MPAAMAVAGAGILISVQNPNPNPNPSSRILALNSPSPQIHRLFIASHRRTPTHMKPSTIPRFSAVAAVSIDKETDGSKSEDGDGAADDEKRRKLYVVNLPWDFSAPQIQQLFGQCGTVKSVEIIRQNNGKSRGFGFVTMSSGDEAQAAVEKFNSYELMGRKIRVEFAKTFRKPAPPPPPGTTTEESRHKIYVSNLAWKARSVHLKEFFSGKFKPLSVKVVFENATRSAGYGFIAFDTKEEAEAAISELDGKELLGRPVRLRISEPKDTELESKAEKNVSTDEQSEES